MNTYMQRVIFVKAMQYIEGQPHPRIKFRCREGLGVWELCSEYEGAQVSATVDNADKGFLFVDSQDWVVEDSSGRLTVMSDFTFKKQFILIQPERVQS